MIEKIRDKKMSSASDLLKKVKGSEDVDESTSVTHSSLEKQER